MATTLDQQVALDEALVPSAQILRIGRSNFRLPSDIQSKEPTLQVVYDVLHVNVNKLYQPWRSFAAVINKCLTGKSSGIDSLRISQAQILWGLYHGSNVDYAYLIWEDFVYQVEHKSQKKSNEMYYPRFTKVIIDYFMMRKPSIPRRNRVNWHYVRDDVLFTTIKVVSRHQITQQYSVILPIKLTNDDIRNSKGYKEYYACATGEAAPRPKASARKKTGGSASSITPPTPIATPTPTTTAMAAPRLSAAKGKQPARATTPTEPIDVERTKAEQLKIVLKRSRQETHISQQRGSDTEEGTGSRPGVPDVPSYDSEEELLWDSFDDEDVDDQTKGREESEGDKTDESDDDNDEDETTKIGEQKVAESDEDDDEATEISQETEDTHVIITPTQSDAQQESSSTSSFMTNLLNPITDPGLESLFTTGSTTVTLIPLPQSTMNPSIMLTFTSASQLPTPPTQIPSLDLQNLPTFASVFHFEDRVKSLEDNFSNIPGIVNQYMNQQMPEAVREAMQTQTNQLQDSIQKENDEFLKTIDDNIKKIIKEQVKSQVKAQVTRILPRIEEAVNAQLEAEVLTRSSHSSRTSYAVAADLSEMELKKILIEKMEGNNESAFAEEPVQPTCQMEEPSHSVFKTGVDDQPIVQPSQHPEWFLQPSRPPTPDRDWNKSVPAAQGEAQSWINALAKQTDARSSFNELLDTPIDFFNFIMNRLGVDTLNPELLAGLTYELMRRGHEPISYDKHALWGVSHWGQKRQQFYGFTVNWESALDVYSKRRIIALSNLTVEERFAFNVSLRMFTRSIVIQRRVKDLQLEVESYQKRLNLTKPDTYRLDLKRGEAYTAYSNPRGFIYQNKDKKNRLMRIDELQKFNDGTLNDVRNALDDYLKGIRMQYLPTTIWRRRDKDIAAAMIQAIDKMLKTRRIMRSLEKFVGGRLYEGYFCMLQRTI
nr:hypothetical protein [Tanacetum cinerariifolium]